LGIEENNLENEISIYPTLASDKIYIEQLKNEAIAINIFDVVGKQVSKETRSENTITEIDMNGLSEGIYFVKVNTKYGMLTKKIVIQH